MDKDVMSEEELWLALPTVEKEEKADLLMALARQASSREAHLQSLELAEAALVAYEELGAAVSQEDVATCHWGIGYANKALRRFDVALKEIDLAITLYRNCGFAFLGDVLRTRGDWCSEIEDWEAALAGHLESVRHNEIEGNIVGEASAWLKVGYVYNNLKRFDEAAAAFENARGKYKEQKVVTQVARCERWLANCFVELGEAKRAYELARRSMNIAELSQERYPIIYAHLALGRALMALENLVDAETHFDDAYRLSVQCDASDMEWDFIIKVQSELSKLYRLQGRGEEADVVDDRIQSVQDVIK
jgi:tetratricopeptide (TPR) repeat protein